MLITINKPHCDHISQASYTLNMHLHTTKLPVLNIIFISHSNSITNLYVSNGKKYGLFCQLCYLVLKK